MSFYIHILNTATILNLKQDYSFPFYSSEQNVFSAGNMALYKWLLEEEQ